MRTLSHYTRVLAAAASLALPAVTAAQSSQAHHRRALVREHLDRRQQVRLRWHRQGHSGSAHHRPRGQRELPARRPRAHSARRRRADPHKSGAIDPQTAVRLGKILGAHYVIYGSFMNAPGGAILTAHTTDMETSQIQNPLKVNGTPTT